MTARDEMAALLANRLGAGRGRSLDAISTLAKEPETAPVVLDWLVEAGVLTEGLVECACFVEGDHYHSAGSG